MGQCGEDDGESEPQESKEGRHEMGGGWPLGCGQGVMKKTAIL